ncbi:MAG: cytochrome c biogenesis protein CcsA [Pseudomonadota bacterium]
MHVLENLLNILTHPFIPQGLLTVFVFAEGLKCIKKTSNNAQYRISIIILCLLFIYGFYAHVCVDTRYLFVMQNNHPAQAIYYRIASLWSHHETSLFIWLVILNSTTYILRLPPNAANFRERILGLLNCLLGFYMLMEANPFATTPFAQPTEESHGLNPLLYDMNMVWHPPLLYLGVTWLFSPYVLSLWLQRTGEVTLIPLIQRQTKIAFGLLTLAIALGSFWAFTQLGWGGFWFWDPVETASLLPWVTALIVFHTSPLSLKKHPWIGGLPFAAVMLSLWAVRSGMLVSVHSFANDVMAFWLLGALAVFTCVPVLILALSSSFSTLSSSPLFLSSLSKRGFSLLNALLHRFSWIPTYAGMAVENERPTIPYMRIGLSLLALTLFLLMLGLFIPVLFDFSLVPTFFNTMLLPIWIPIALLMTLAPYKGFYFGTSTTAALLGLTLYLIFYAHLALPYLLLGASGAICASAMLPLIHSKTCVSFAHMGIGLFLIGLASHSDSPPETTLTLTRGAPVLHTSYKLTFEDTFEVAESFKTNQDTHIRIELTDSKTTSKETLILAPAKQFFYSSKLQRVKADFGLLNKRVVIITNIETLPDARIAITFHEKSGLLWLIFGCGLIVFSLLIIPLRKSILIFKS